MRNQREARGGGVSPTSATCPTRVSRVDAFIAKCVAEREQKRFENAKRLFVALLQGPVINAGNLLFDANKEYLGMTRTDMYYAVRRLQGEGMRIERTDAGGNPTWVLLAIG